jgi:outer membrane protein OmpA-like peptidoglycan-associated protein
MKRSTALVFTWSMACVGCASAQPSAQLVDARRAYQQAEQGPAARLAPATLYEAKAALMEAEAAQRDDPGSLRAVSLAYIADRKALEAMALADQSQAHHQIALAKQQERDLLENQRRVAELSLEETQKELARVRGQLQARGNELNDATQKLRERETELAHREQELQTERAARAQAEKTAREAVASLDKLAKIQQQAERTVITLSGQVLFPFGKATLLPAARLRLSQVATALKTQPPETMIVVNGYTDSVGRPEDNLKLSRERAEAVRDYLVSQGVTADRIRAFGYGAESPIASNKTLEGRADNRRVEIVLENEKAGKLSAR